MKEWLVLLIPKSGGARTKTRLFATNSASACSVARQMYPNYHIGIPQLIK